MKSPAFVDVFKNKSSLNCSRMAQWLHCNTCFRQPGDGCIFFLTGCGHIFCQKCEQKGWRQKCLLCGTGKPAALQLTAQLPAHVQAFFSDPVAMLKRTNNSNARHIAQTLEWQNCHKKRYFNNLKDMVAQQKHYTEQLKKEFQKFIEQKEKNFQVYIEKLKTEFQYLFEQKKRQFQEHVKTMEKEFIKLKDENSYLKRLLSEKSPAAYSRSSPSGDRNRSPTMKGMLGSSPNNLSHQSVRSIQDRLHGQQSTHASGYRISPSNSCTVISGRVATKTPPAGGRLGFSRYSPGYALHQNVPSIEDRLHKLQSSQNTGYKSSPQNTGYKMSPSNTITSGRISMRTPPSGGKLGVIPSTPSSQFYRAKTPKSVPHPMGFDYELETPSS